MPSIPCKQANNRGLTCTIPPYPIPRPSPSPRVETLSEADVPAGGGGDEDHARVAPRRVQREEGGLADGVVFGVDAQEGAPYIGKVAAARPISVVVLKTVNIVVFVCVEAGLKKKKKKKNEPVVLIERGG